MLKGNFNMAFAVIAMALIALFLVPGLGNSLMVIISGQADTCTNAPFIPECICPEGTERAWFGGVTGFSCVPTGTSVSCVYTQQYYEEDEPYTVPELWKSSCSCDQGRVWKQTDTSWICQDISSPAQCEFLYFTTDTADCTCAGTWTGDEQGSMTGWRCM